MAKKVYTLVKYEVKDGCDALNVLMVSTDKKKILKKYQREVAADKKVNPFWKKFKDRKLFGIQDREVVLAIDVLNKKPPRNSMFLNHELMFRRTAKLNGFESNIDEIYEKFYPFKNEKR